MEKVNPTCVLKVNLQCCKACPAKVKKQLKKINGVNHIDIDMQKNLVTVSGVEDASILVKAIEKVGRKAELCKTQTKHKEDSKDHSTSKCNCNEVDVHAGHTTWPVPPHPYGRHFYAGPPPPPPPYNYYQPLPLPPPMPQRPIYPAGELNHGNGPADNNIFHIFDDLNVHSCNIS